MNLPSIDTSKLVKNFSLKLLSIVTALQEHLLSGDFQAMETGSQSLMNEIYDEVVEEVIKSVARSQALKLRLLDYGKKLGLKRLRVRKTSVQIRTGTIIYYISYYAQDSPSAYSGSRHVTAGYWGLIGKASPHYYTMAGMVSVLCPSFAIGVQLVSHLGIQGNYNRFRCLALQMSKAGKSMGVKALLKEGESLKGKRVVVSIDGGRTRTRSYTGKFTKKGNEKFDTDWREPKLFVIHVLDEEGKIARKTELPFYGVTMEDIHESMNQLTTTLIALQAHEAKEVQFIADGATGIWNNIKAALLNAGIPAKKITFTLDYYHAVEHLSKMIKMLPNLTEKEQKTWLKELKDDLWEGNIFEIKRKVKLHIENNNQKISDHLQTELTYFDKHIDRMKYKTFKRKKWLCGSGLVESAIRRIINLRFKSPSSFWMPENMEQLCFLRATFLAGRWKYLTLALAKHN